MSYSSTDRAATQRLVSDNEAVRQPWLDWVMFAVAYAIIVGWIIFAVPAEGQRHADRGSAITTIQAR